MNKLSFAGCFVGKTDEHKAADEKAHSQKLPNDSLGGFYYERLLPSLFLFVFYLPCICVAFVLELVLTVTFEHVFMEDGLPLNVSNHSAADDKAKN